MIPVKGYKGQKVAVLGLGRSGLATADALQAGGAEPCATNLSPVWIPRWRHGQGESCGLLLRNRFVEVQQHAGDDGVGGELRG